MTPDDIRSQRFATRLMRGLSPEEVTAFLEDVAEAYDNLQKANVVLAARVKSLEDEIRAVAGAATPVALRVAPERDASASAHIELLRTAALREVEALLHDAQAQAQAIVDAARERDAAMLKDTEALKARMQQEAAEVVAGATASAESLLSAAKDRESGLRDEIERLTQSRLQLVDDIRATLDTYEHWLGSVDPRGRARGRAVLDGHERAPADDEARVG
jgi:DivIVA domain-containing protein